MTIKHTKDEISFLLENLKEQFEIINQHNGNIPQIELDIFKRNIQKLYENLNYLDNINQSVGHKDSFQDADKVNKPAENQKVVSIIESETKEKMTLIEEDSIDKNMENQMPPNDLKNTKDEALEKEYPDQKKQEKVESNKNKMEADLFTGVVQFDEKKDLNNKIAENRNTQSIVEKLQTKRIESLKTVIGINDKFYFINELFSGDIQKYEDIIYTLNNFKKLEDAQVYFSTLKYKFSWDENSEAFQKLNLMLERKFELTSI
jgi:hypothetical protein